MRKVSLAIVLLLSCTDEGRTRDIVEAEGYTDVQTMGYSFRCSDDDTSCTGFSATAPNGRDTVKGVVGCGMHGGCGKSCTLRITHVIKGGSI